MASSPFMAALEQLSEERGLPVETVIQTVEAALAAAYRKDYGKPGQVIRATLDAKDLAKTKMSQVFEVIADDIEVEEPERQLTETEAKKIDKNAEVGGEVTVPLPEHADFGRIAAQTAKQVIIQRIAEAERSMLYQEFKDKEGQIVSGTIQQIEGKDAVVNIGRMNAVMLPHDQISNERYYTGQRLKLYVRGVEETNRGPKVLVSRTHPDLIRGLFTQEVPEIQSGTVTIEAIAREPGSRTKIAVSAHQDGLDPVGSCVGQRGIRVQAVLSELNEEKIDIILWDTNPMQLIENALSPAKVESITLDDATKTAKIQVPDDQVSLAIGRSGQNVRLASKLTGWNLDIIKDELPKKASETDEQNTDDSNAVGMETTTTTTTETPIDAVVDAATEMTEPTTE